MSDTVSESVTGQNEPKPTREERDEAFSAGAGRKAVEKPKVPRKHGADEALRPPVGSECETRIRPPIGLECETKGDVPEAS